MLPYSIKKSLAVRLLQEPIRVCYSFSYTTTHTKFSPLRPSKNNRGLGCCGTPITATLRCTRSDYSCIQSVRMTHFGLR